jgi:hypothetical protein
VLHSTDDIAARGVIGLHLVGQGSARGFRFENITVEDVRGPRRPALKVFNNWDDWHLNHPTRPDSPYELLGPPARTKPNGTIRDVVFRNVKVLQSKNPDVVVMADSEASRVEDVAFEDVAVNGRALTPGDPRLKTNAWTRDVVIRR